MWGKHTQPLMEINEPSLAGASMPLVPASIVGLPPLADALPFAGTEAPPVAGLPLYLTGPPSIRPAKLGYARPKERRSEMKIADTTGRLPFRGAGAAPVPVASPLVVLPAFPVLPPVVAMAPASGAPLAPAAASRAAMPPVAFPPPFLIPVPLAVSVPPVMTAPPAPARACDSAPACGAAHRLWQISHWPNALCLSFSL